MSTMTVYNDRVELSLDNRTEFVAMIDKLHLFKIPFVVDDNEILIHKNNFTYNLLFIISNNTRSLMLI